MFPSDADMTVVSAFSTAAAPARAVGRAGRRVLRLAPVVLLALLALPSTAAAQRDGFFSALLLFYRTLGGVYGDEGPQLTEHLDAMATALARWDEAILDAERQLRPRLNGADPQTALQIHAILASLYMERGRFDEALRQFDEDRRIDPARAAFPRFQGLIHQIASRPAAAADAFRAAWLLEPDDPQNAYRLIAFASARSTAPERARALDTLRIVERELVNGTRPRAKAPFVNVGAIVDDAGGAMAFVPAAYAGGFSLILKGDLNGGVAALRSAAASDPLVVDAATRPETMDQGIAALRQGQVTAAIELLETAVARVGDSSEAHRILATAYHVHGDVAKSLDHVRESLRLNPRDERSWLAMVRTLDQAGRTADAEQTVRDAIGALPDSGALRWELAAFAARQQRTRDADLALMTAIDRYVLLAGRGELYILLARLARTHLDYQRAITLLEHAIALNLNHLAAHKALGRGLIEDGREDEGYAELVVALMLDPDDRDTRIELARVHLAAGRGAEATELLEPTVAADGADREAVRTLGEALIRAGRTAEGQRQLEEAERLQAQAVEEERGRRTAATLTLQAEVRMTERDYRGAIDLWQQAATMQRGSASIHLRLADALAAAQRLDEAAAAYQTAIALDAGADAHRRLADVWAALGRQEDSARARAAYVARQLEELGQRAAGAIR